MNNLIACKKCSRTFCSISNLNRHRRNIHSKKNQTEKKYHNFDSLYICDVCHKRYHNRKNFINHWNYNHATRPKIALTSRCPLCKGDIRTHLLIEHFTREHGIEIEEQKLTFPNQSSFDQWKKKLEEETSSKYITGYTNKETKQKKYYCHRSGTFNSKSKGIRHLKPQGSKKIGGVCPASLLITYRDETLHVKFISTHVGHDCSNDLCHLNISISKKYEIAKQLMEKVPKSCILENIHDSCDGVVKRDHLITMKDVDNVAAKFNLTSEFKKVHDDSTSVHSTIKDLEKEENSFILFYKPQHEFNYEYPFLKNDDFVLIIMNTAQAEILKKYGSKIICVDSTRGVGNDFELFSIVVLDDLDQGFPCAMMISNRKDTQVLEFFYSAIKNVVQNINPKVFLSDMVDGLYNAWQNIMGSVELRLYCTWHVDKAWRNNINKMKNLEKRTILYQRLKAVMHELDENKFVILLEDLISLLRTDEQCKQFGDYFMANYLDNTQRWAYCFRKNAGINTNLSVERMHRTIEYLYFKGKKIGRLDQSIHHIVKFLKDKLFDRLTVMYKGKVSQKLKISRKRHRNWKSVDVTTVDDFKSFLITSDANMYHVERNTKDCNNCRLVCSFCKACIHNYSCTCHDYSINWNMCKHIHAVCQFIINNCVSSNEPLSTAEVTSTSTNFFTDDSGTENCDIVDDVENIIIDKISNHKPQKATKKSLKLMFLKIFRKVENSPFERSVVYDMLKNIDKKIDLVRTKTSQRINKKINPPEKLFTTRIN